MLNVLSIDDQPEMHLLIGHHLRAQLDDELAVHTALDEAEAMEAVAGSTEFDVVLIDLRLPEFTGLDLMEKLLAARPDLAVVVVSGEGSEQTVVEALERGAMSYVDKATIAKVLVPTVRKVVDARRKSVLRERVHAGMTSARYSYELDNDPGLIPPMLEEVREVFERFGIGRPNPTQQIIGVEEALANAMYHGNLEIGSELKHADLSAFYKQAQAARHLPVFRDRRVRLHLEVRNGSAWVTIIDDGRGFDPAGVPDPTLPENAGKPHGRGLLLMRAFFDEVVYNARGNEVTLVIAPATDGEFKSTGSISAAA